jgi:antitoxin VapB
MTRHILSDEAERLARQVAEETGDSLTEVVMRALRAEAERTLPRPQVKPRTREEKLAFMSELQRRSAALPVLDPRTPEEMLYDEDGLPK